MLNTVIDRAKDQLKRRSPALLRLLGTQLLSKPQTIALLKPDQVGVVAKIPVFLPAITDISASQKVLFAPITARTEPDFVWNYDNTKRQAALLRCGSVQIGRAVLDTDFGNTALLADLLRPDRRKGQYFPTVIAPWSHYWGGYHDFLLFLAAKLCRLKATTDPAVFDQAAVSYPLFNTDFESELLALLGIGPNQLFDSRQHTLTFDRVLLANNSSWFYPTADDVLALKTIVEAQLPPAPSEPPKRLYISRSGRRRVLNEPDLVAMLMRYGFDYIEDNPRSVAGQVRLYQSAEFVVGPHGASFANLLWCRPGTQLIELFAPHYRPDYFRYLAHVLDLNYAGYSCGPVGQNHHTNVNADMIVSVDEVEQGIVQLLGKG